MTNISIIKKSKGICFTDSGMQYILGAHIFPESAEAQPSTFVRVLSSLSGYEASWLGRHYKHHPHIQMHTYSMWVCGQSILRCLAVLVIFFLAVFVSIVSLWFGASVLLSSFTCMYLFAPVSCMHWVHKSRELTPSWGWCWHFYLESLPAYLTGAFGWQSTALTGKRATLN